MTRAFASLAVLLACALGANAAGPVAFVADLKGNATIEGDGKLNFLAELGAGTRLLLGSGASVAVTYASTGTEFTIAGPGEFVVTPTEVRAEKGAPPSRRTVMTLPDPGVVARVSQTATASLRMRGLPPPSSPGAALEYPVDTRVASLQPPLRWRGDRGGDGVTVSVVDAAGKEVWKGAAAPGATAPVKLAPATRYTWTVMTPKGMVGEARFETLPAEAMARVVKSRANAKSFSHRVLHAMLLEDIGASQDAREAWIALARERPELPELAVLAK